MERNSERQPTPGTSGVDILKQINARVGRSEAVCRESEIIATEALDELAAQRDPLTRVRDRLAEANEELSSTNKILKYFHRRFPTDKLLLSAIILMEMIIIGCQLYIKFFK